MIDKYSPIIITSSGKVKKKIIGTVRRSLPYQGIARRVLKVNSSDPSYDREIDVSAVTIK